jgi:hypothetical protein
VAGELLDRRLGHAVGDPTVLPDGRGAGRDEDDRPTAPCPHVGNHGLGEDEGTGGVGAQDAVPGLEIDADGVRVPAETGPRGVVVQKIHTPVVVHGVSHHRLDAVAVRHFTGEADGIPAGQDHLFGNPLGPGRVGVGHRHAGPQFAEVMGGGPTDAGGGPGHDSHLACQCSTHDVLLEPGGRTMPGTARHEGDRQSGWRLWVRASFRARTVCPFSTSSGWSANQAMTAAGTDGGAPR